MKASEREREKEEDCEKNEKVGNELKTIHPKLFSCELRSIKTLLKISLLYALTASQQH